MADCTSFEPGKIVLISVKKKSNRICHLLVLFMIRRSFAELSVSAFAVAYYTLGRPHLENAMQACSPNLVADADSHARNGYVGWVFTPYTGVASVVAS